jgi:hypothetical protein
MSLDQLNRIQLVVAHHAASDQQEIAPTKQFHPVDFP